jgi:hypothetical protein
MLIPDPGVKNASDPGSGSATLVYGLFWFRSGYGFEQPVVEYFIKLVKCAVLGAKGPFGEKAE